MAEQNIVIYIGIYKALGVIVTIIVGAWYASHRLTKIETTVDSFDKRVTNMEGRIDQVYASHSPIALLEKGTQILEKSGLKKWIDEHKDNLVSICCMNHKTDTPYDIQEASFVYFDRVIDFGDFEKNLKEAAYNYGVSLESIKRIGAIYFRDSLLNHKGFRPEDLDKK